MQSGVLKARWIPVLGGLSLALNGYFVWQSIAQPETKQEANSSPAALIEPRMPSPLASSSPPQGVAAPVQSLDVRCANVQTPSAVQATAWSPTNAHQMPPDVAAHQAWAAAQDTSVSLQQLVQRYNESNKPADGFFINPFGR